MEMSLISLDSNVSNILNPLCVVLRCVSFFHLEYVSWKCIIYAYDALIQSLILKVLTNIRTRERYIR